MSDLGTKTSQWSTQSYQKCSDARKTEQNLASQTGRRHFVREECSDARKSRKKLASRTGRRHFAREARSDARKSCKKLASRTERRHFVREECSDARKSRKNLASLRNGAIARWGVIEMGQYGLGNVRGVKNILLFLHSRLEMCGYERFCRPHQSITNQ